MLMLQIVQTLMKQEQDKQKTEKAMEVKFKVLELLCLWMEQRPNRLLENYLLQHDYIPLLLDERIQ